MFAFFLLAFVAAVNAGTVPNTVKELDVNKFIGLWYQMYSDPAVLATFEKDAYCATATYGIQADGNISVHNAARLGGTNGTLSVIDGYAYGSDPNEPGQLLVHFDEGSPVDGAYWIVDLGPVNKDGLYDWTIVSNNHGSDLFVLARDVDTWFAEYDTSVIAEVNSLGLSYGPVPIKAIPLVQGGDCNYEGEY